MRIDDGQGGRHGAKQARQRANPMGSRPSGRRGGPGATVNINDGIRPGNASIKGVAAGQRQQGGRIPGGGGLAGGELPKTNNVVALLKRFLESRWNGAAKFLNLENMKDDPILAAENVKPPGVEGSPKELANVMWKICKELYPDVVTISLANNDFRSLGPVYSLPTFFPDLQNLSLEGNELKWVKDLDSFASKSRKLSSLKELLLLRNPVHDNAVAAGNEESYRKEVLSRFSTLSLLDQKPVTPVEAGFAKLPVSAKAKKLDADAAQVPLRNFPIQNKPGFVDQDAGRIMPDFLSKFFSLYDTDRSALAQAYASSAKFSYCINMSPPPRARAAGFIHTMPHQKDLSFEKYQDLGNRNLMRVQAPKSRFLSLQQGSAAIISRISKMPKTTHPLTDASKFVVDAWVMPNAAIGARIKEKEVPEAVLFISVHGEFAEAPSEGIRSFDRTFLVAPVPPGSEAANAGWPCVILSDQLTVRHYSSPSAWALDALPTGAVDPGLGQGQGQEGLVVASQPAGLAASLPAHLQNQAPAPGINEQQHLLSLQLAAETGLNYPFAVQCLSENGWDPATAMTNFQNLKVSGSKGSGDHQESSNLGFCLDGGGALDASFVLLGHRADSIWQMGDLLTSRFACSAFCFLSSLSSSILFTCFSFQPLSV
ncbi:NTF2-like protein [Violaceomyces palustris]|uniref:NTF2-like protein n=1 Tax=Violaceomyces palustris TaxID=1673888 RepID=A0ACD0P059_9BASI|nr:NTF2-like protein [Violaceomyces palustris]